MYSWFPRSLRKSASCVAVGSGRDRVNRTLVAGWDGSSWAVAASPNPGGVNSLTGVSCVADAGSFCVAVGSAGPAVGIAARPLVLHSAPS